jgi:hypothetical protein
VMQLDALCRAAADLAEAAGAAFAEHPDTAILSSFPGSGRSPAPGCWVRSAMTRPGSPMPAG